MYGFNSMNIIIFVVIFYILYVIAAVTKHEKLIVVFDLDMELYVLKFSIEAFCVE